MQRYFAVSKDNNNFILNDDDYHHIRNVMRMNSGDKVEVVYDNNVYLSEVVIGDNVSINELELIEERNDKIPNIVLIIPFLKEQKLDYIFQKGTELGVSKFILVDTERSIVKVEKSKESVKINRWQKICKEASEQSKRSDIPLVIIEKDKSALEKLPGLKLICSTTEHEKTIKNILKNNSNYDTINLMIGPEGGLSSNEENYYEQKGFVRVSLGSQIMRVETVPIFIASIIRYEYME